MRPMRSDNQGARAPAHRRCGDGPPEEERAVAMKRILIVEDVKFNRDLAKLSSGVGDDDAVHLSADAFERVRGRCTARAVGRVSLKGKGEVEVHQCDSPLCGPEAELSLTVAPSS